jgi:hypothetical protein
MPSYVARPHVLAGEFVPGYLGDSFGLLSFVHGDPLANQFDGPFLVRLIRKEVTHTSGFPLGIESRDPDIPSCWHAGTMRRSSCWSIPRHNQADPTTSTASDCAHTPVIPLNRHRPTAAAEPALIGIVVIASVMAFTVSGSADVNPNAVRTNVHTLSEGSHRHRRRVLGGARFRSPLPHVRTKITERDR